MPALHIMGVQKASRRNMLYIWSFVKKSSQYNIYSFIFICICTVVPTIKCFILIISEQLYKIIGLAILFCLSFVLFVYRCISISIYQYIYSSILLNNIFLCLCLSVYLSVCLSVCLHIRLLSFDWMIQGHMTLNR